MVDTYSSFLKVRLLESGAYNNSWGSVHNSDAVNLLDYAIAGRAQIDLGTSTTYGLAALADGGASEARAAVLEFSGSPPSAVTVTVPVTVVQKTYIVDNQTAQTITIKYATGTGVDVVAGTRRIVVCDGTIPQIDPVFASASDADTLDGIDSTQFARLDVANSFTKRNRSPFIAVTENPTTTFDSALGNNFFLQLTGNRIMGSPTNLSDGHVMTLIVQQDGTGGRTLTWNSIFIFENGITPTLSSAAGTSDLFLMVYNQSMNKVLVSHFPAMALPGGATYSYRISENTVDWNLLAKVGTLGSPVTVNITLEQGVIVQASCPGSPAMDLSGLPSGSTVNLDTGAGYIIGRGGRGGDGQGSTDRGSNIVFSVQASPGEAGGNAIVGPGSGRTFNITNANGFIWGGGGGGGGGGSSTAVGFSQAGGGGGGGAGGGPYGTSRGVSIAGNVGTSGSAGPVGTPGTGGAGSTTGGGAAGNGGDGGAYGTAGSAGASSFGGAGGAAGKAIELGGGSANFISGSGSPNVKGAVS